MPTVKNVKQWPVEIDTGATILSGQEEEVNTAWTRVAKLITAGELVVTNAGTPAPTLPVYGAIIVDEDVPDNGRGNNGDYWHRPVNGTIYLKVAGVWEELAGAGGGTAKFVGTDLASLELAAADKVNGSPGQIRLGAWPNVDAFDFTWNATAGIWVGEDLVTMTQMDTHAMDLGNRSAADLLLWSRIDNPVPFGRAFTYLNGAQDLSTAAFTGGTGVLTVNGTAGMGSGRPPFPATGTLYVRDNVITYTGITGTTFTGCTRVSGSGGTLPDDTDVVALFVGGFGFSSNPLFRVGELWAAGFRLQEKCIAMMNGQQDNVHKLEVAPHWYEFNDGDGNSFSAATIPLVGGIGRSASIQSIANGGGGKGSERNFYKVENAWSMWAAGVPAKKYMVPVMAGRMDAGSVDTGEVLDLKLEMRWIGTP